MCGSVDIVWVKNFLLAYESTWVSLNSSYTFFGRKVTVRRKRPNNEFWVFFYQNNVFFFLYISFFFVMWTLVSLCGLSPLCWCFHNWFSVVAIFLFSILCLLLMYEIFFFPFSIFTESSQRCNNTISTKTTSKWTGHFSQWSSVYYTRKFCCTGRAGKYLIKPSSPPRNTKKKKNEHIMQRCLCPFLLCWRYKENTARMKKTKKKKLFRHEKEAEISVSFVILFFHREKGKREAENR